MGPTLNTAREGACAAVLDGCLYVIGGLPDLWGVEVLRGNCWEIAGDKVSVPRFGASAVVLTDTSKEVGRGRLLIHAQREFAKFLVSK